MPDPALCAAESHDADALMRLINFAFRAERPFVKGDRIDLAEVRDRLAKGHFLIAREESALLGCVYAESDRDHGYIGLLAIEPAHQRGGLGPKLMRAAEEHLRAAGCRSVSLRFINHRTELLRFYGKLGYEETGTAAFPLTARMKMPFHFIEMTKAL